MESKMKGYEKIVNDYRERCTELISSNFELAKQVRDLELENVSLLKMVEQLQELKDLSKEEIKGIIDAKVQSREAVLQMNSLLQFTKIFSVN